MVYVFSEYSLDADRRELRHGVDLVALEPQRFDLLLYLIQNRERVVSKDDIFAAIWNGRIVSESTLSSQITAVRHAIGDDGGQQLLVRTYPRKGFRFVGEVQEQHEPKNRVEATMPSVQRAQEPVAAPVKSDRPERRQLTTIICNLVGSTAFSARRDPEELMEVFAAYHACIKDVVAPYDGFISRAVGDEILIYFGYPLAHEDDAERAVRAGLAVIKAVGELGARSDNSIQARMAIATGLVVIGDLKGPGTASDHAAIGDSLPLAAGLLDLAEPGSVVISATTRRLIGDLFDYKDLGLANLKSIADPVEVWQVLSESAIVSRFDALHSGRIQLIGRDEELELLQRRWKQVKSGEGRVVLIYGEPGIGKSRLAFALQEAVADEAHKCLRFYCSPYRIQTALYPAISQLEYAAGFAPADDDETKLGKLEALLALSSHDVSGDIALFAELLSIPSHGHFVPLSISPQRRKELILERFTSQLAGLAAREPVMMVLEDAHWVDPTTRELFDIAVERVRTLPVLPEFPPPWLGQSHVTVLTLNRLGRRDMTAMIHQVAKGKGFPPTVVEQIVTRTDGVPLFVEEMTKSVLESDALREENGNYVLAGALPVLTIPTTLQASLVARLDRLASLRIVVQAGAALGREFSYPLLRAVCGLTDAELIPFLDQLVASELVHQRGSAPHALYTFKHALVQDAAYDTMLKSQRAQMHARIVDVFENNFPEMPERNPDVLAYHCTEAGLSEKAINYWLKSARMALDRSAGVEARAQVDKATTLLPKIEDSPARRQFEGRVQVALGDTLVMTQGFASPDVAAALSKARSLLDDSAHPIETLRALGGLFSYHLMRSEAPQGLKLAEPLLQRPADRLSLVVTHFMAGTANLHIGNFVNAQNQLEKALTLYEEDACRAIAFIGGIHIRSFTLVWLSLTYLYLGKLKLAADTMAAAVTDARSRLHPFTLVSALLASARFFNHTRDLKAAIAATDEGFAIATEQRSPYHISRARILQAVNVVESGRPIEGISLMDHALVAHRKTGANFQSSFNLSCLAKAYARAGTYERALDFADQAIQEVEQTGERWWAAEAQRIRGEILLASAPTAPSKAEECLQAALEIAQSQQAKFWGLCAANSMARLWQAQGRNAEARDLLAPAYNSFGDGIEQPDLNDARLLLARLRQPSRPLAD